jgi:elongation factor Ts
MLEKIALGRLNKFYKENTLLNQAFIKDGKKSVSQYLNDHKKDMTVLMFKRLGLGN